MRRLIDSALLRNLAGVALFFAATVALAWRVDLPAALRLLDDVEASWAALGVGLFGLSKLVHAARWQLLMRPFARPRFTETLKLFLMGNLVNGLLPFRAGDLARVQIAARRLRVPRAQMVSSVFVVETLFDGLAFVGLLCCALALGDVPGLTRGLFLTLAAASVGACGAAALLSARADQVGRWLGHSRLPGAAIVAPFLSGLLDGLRPLADLRAVMPAFALASLGWALEAGAYAAIGEAFGLELGAADYLAVMIAANLLTALPLTPLGFGVYEFGLQELVTALGPVAEVALAYVLGAHVVFSAWIVSAGAIAAWTLHLKPGELLYVRGDSAVAETESASGAGRKGRSR